jgi:Holliday junction resolvase RusA-like endonuclease
MRFVLEGIIPSKKNNYTITHNLFMLSKECNRLNGADAYKYIKANLKPRIVASNNYLEWEKRAIDEIVKQLQHWLQKYDLIAPFADCSLKVYHYWKDNLRRDNANKLQSLQDMLVKAGVIVDDDYMYLNKTTSEAENYKGELNRHITLIDLTIRVS